MIRIAKHPRINGKMSTAGRLLRIVTPVVALLAAATIGSHAARADMVVVQQDNTPIASAPGVGGRILARADAGVTLTVLGREGEWLQVEGAHLPATGTLWIPAERVGDIIAAPAAMATAQPAAVAEVPQFRMMTGSTEITSTLGTEGAAGARNSGGVSASAARSTETNARAGTAAAVQSGGTTAAAGGASTTAVGNTASAATTGGTTVDGNPTPAQGNSTTAVSGNPTPALGNPTPAATGNPTPALGNPTPAMGNPVSGFGRTTARTP